ncbi:hypothetical protein GQ54DRAFT_93054 [Martensiomyces pterosporus]|nr:hypothetical protein GQ54DRAFT_93054 [Martensiomyces pterosporus]
MSSVTSLRQRAPTNLRLKPSPDQTEEGKARRGDQGRKQKPSAARQAAHRHQHQALSRRHRQPPPQSQHQQQNHQLTMSQQSQQFLRGCERRR